MALSVFDSALTELKLPLLRPIIEEDPVKPEDDIEIPLEFVASLAQKYFDWVGAFEEGA